MGGIEWQLSVQKRIQSYVYSETEKPMFYLTREEYGVALKNYQDRMEKMLARTVKR